MLYADARFAVEKPKPFDKRLVVEMWLLTVPLSVACLSLSYAKIGNSRSTLKMNCDSSLKPVACAFAVPAKSKAPVTILALMISFRDMFLLHGSLLRTDCVR